jgi:AraC-like DNA-binding protein
MKKLPLLIGAGEDLHEYYRNFPFGEETVVVASPGRLPDHLRRTRWDLLLLDCGGGIQQGLTLLREIKPAYPDLPVLFLAEAGSEEAVLSAFRLGARDYIRKPFDVLDLKSRIETFLRLKRLSGESRPFVSSSEAGPSSIREAPEGDCLPPSILRAIKYMEENLAQPVSLDVLAREAGLSRHHFCRTFAEAMQMPPVRFLNYLRVQWAKRLLGRNGLNLSAVALKVGFGNVNNLNKWFKVFEKSSPSRFRQKPGNS